jgi:peroxiredoxin Q/BCP
VLREFADEHDLPFTLLSDPDHKVAEKYAVWVEKSMYGRTFMSVQRSTFVIGPDRKLLKAFRNITPKTHEKRVLEALAQ